MNRYIRDCLRETGAGYIGRILALAAILTISSCTPTQVASALEGLSLGAQWLGTVIDVARGGADAFSARHPNRERDAAIARAERGARSALAAYEGLLAAGRAVDNDDVVAARAALVTAYGALRALLDEAGVLDARSPAGGAETESPAPEPVSLPSVDEVAARLQ